MNTGRPVFKYICFAMIAFICSCSGSNPISQEGQVNAQQIEEAFNAAGQMTNLRSLIVQHKGRILNEHYFGTGSESNTYNVRSVTKSVMALLIGIAIDKGYISSIDQNISSFLEPLVSNYPSDKSTLKIRHLITMSGGFQGNELTNPEIYNEWATADDRVSFILSVPLVFTPGTHFSYDSRPYHLLSVILTRATGLSTKDFTERYLFAPLSIGSRNWGTDRQGYFNGSSDLFLTAQDMIKVGELVMNDGIYNGTRVISAEWIAQIKETKIETQNALLYGSGYSFGFWTGSYNNRNYIFALGWGGQFVVIVPSLELIITAANYSSGISETTAGLQWQSTIDLIMTRILTAFY